MLDKLLSSFYTKGNKLVKKHAPSKTVLHQKKNSCITRGTKKSIKVKLFCSIWEIQALQKQNP